MKLRKLLTPILTLGMAASLFGAQDDQLNDLDMKQVSESFGYLIHKNVESLGLDLDVNLVVKGIENSLAGKAAPMDEQQTVQAIALIQENAFHKQAQVNLQLAEEFLAGNRMKEEVFELEEGKVQYAINEQGAGEIVQEDSTPTIRYTGEFADGTVFASSKDEEVITLSETIPGFAKALIGMKEGEKRTAYIHPEFAYGESNYVPPNSLLTFHIEVIKANTPIQEMEEQQIDQAFEELANQEGEEALR